MEALITGVVTLSRGCLLVDDFPVVWPHGTTWTTSGDGVRLADGDLVWVGERVKGAGGYLKWADLRTELRVPLAECPVNEFEEVAVFNAGEQVDVDE